MFHSLSMIQNSIAATSQAMAILSSNAQAFQTDGYKQQTFTFTAMFQHQLHGFYASGSGGARSLSQGVSLVSMGYDMSQGGIKKSGPLNAAIKGPGFFILEGSIVERYVLTRASDFIFSANGTLCDIFGRKVKGYRIVDGTVDQSVLVDIKLDTTVTISDVRIQEEGMIYSSAGEDTQPVYQLAMARVSNASQMAQVQGNAFRPTINSGPITAYGVSGDPLFGQVSGGFSESSNVNPAELTIMGIQLQRGYQAIQAALTMSNRFLTQLMDVAGKA
jgi:flagellar hook protein FlgE